MRTLEPEYRLVSRVSDLQWRSNYILQNNVRCNCLSMPWKLAPKSMQYGDRSGSTLAHVMACCLTAPSHYLNQCWLIIGEVLWHSPEGNFTWNVQDIYLWREFENYSFKITSPSPRGQWVNSLLLSLAKWPHRPWPSLVQIMAFIYLTLRHYLNRSGKADMLSIGPLASLSANFLKIKFLYPRKCIKKWCKKRHPLCSCLSVSIHQNLECFSRIRKFPESWVLDSSLPDVYE